MNKLPAETIRALSVEFGTMYKNSHLSAYRDDEDCKVNDGLVSVEYSSCDGSNASCYTIFRLVTKDSEYLLKASGYYSSYDGWNLDFSTLHQVEKFSVVAEEYCPINSPPDNVVEAPIKEFKDSTDQYYIINFNGDQYKVNAAHFKKVKLVKKTIEVFEEID